MSVKQIASAFACGLVMVSAITAYAQARRILPQTQHQVISKLDQLEDDKDVKQYKEMYPALSAANLVYAQCSREFDITEGEARYLKTKFDTVTKAYIAAYQNAYIAATGAATPQSFIDDVVKALTVRQQNAVDSVALLMRQKGCRDGRLKPMVKYVEGLRRQDKALAEQKPAEEAKPYQ